MFALSSQLQVQLDRQTGNERAMIYLWDTKSERRSVVHT